MTLSPKLIIIGTIFEVTVYLAEFTSIHHAIFDLTQSIELGLKKILSLIWSQSIFQLFRHDMLGEILENFYLGWT